MVYPGRQQSLKLSISVSSGAGTGLITSTWDIARRIRVIPPNETVTYACTIKDADGYLIFDSSKTGGSLTGTLSMLNETSMAIANTVNITGSNTDGTFVVKFDMH